MKCPLCDEGDLVLPTKEVPSFLLPPVYECTECGDLVSLADYDKDLKPHTKKEVQ